LRSYVRESGTCLFALVSGEDVMNSSNERDLFARLLPNIPMIRVAVLSGALVVLGCTGRDSASSSESASSVSGPDAEVRAGRGHLQLTGDATVDTDFAVEQCSIGPSGAGLLDGYRMSARSSHGTLQMLSVVVKNYEHDGSFTPSLDTG
jgi:hypothetical protein